MRCRVLVGVLTVVAAAAVGCSSQAVPHPPAPTPAPPTTAPKGADKGVRGQITAETGSTWTVTNAKGKAFTVTVNGQTAFGTAAAPGTAAQFPVGTTVRVVGSRTGKAVTATRITAAKSADTTSSASPSAAPAGLPGT